MSLHLAIEQLKRSIDALTIEYPELADDPILRADMIEGATNLNDVIAMLLEQVQEGDAMADAIKARRSVMGERQARYELRADVARSLLQSLMERAGLRSAILPEATVTVSQRKAIPVIVDASLLPEECCKMVRTPDKKTINAWVSAGNIPEGVSVGNGSSVLTIKRT